MGQGGSRKFWHRTQAKNSFAETVGPAESIKCVASIHKFVPEQTATVYAIAKILYELSALHEFAVLPMRHNEEELNLELSRLFSQYHFLLETHRNPWGEMQFGKILEDLDALASNIAFDVKGNNILTLIIMAGVDRIRVRQQPKLNGNKDEDSMLMTVVSIVSEYFAIVPAWARFWNSHAVMHARISPRFLMLGWTFSWMQIQKG